MRWIELGKGIPPMRFDLLMDGAISNPALRDEMDTLVEIKRQGGEQDTFTPPPLTAAYVAGELLRLEKEPPTLSTEQEKADLDGIFRTTLGTAWSTKSFG